MEIPFAKKISTIALELYQQNAIDQTQKKDFIQDFNDFQKSTQLAQKFQQKYLKHYIKFFIGAYYSKNRKLRNQKPSSTLSYNKLIEKKKSRNSDLNSEEKERNMLTQLVENAQSTLKEKFHNTIRFLSQMICNKKQKVIQTYTTKLLYLLLETNQFFYLRFNKGNQNAKIEYYNSRLNYLTVFMDGQRKYNDIMKACTTIKQKVCSFNGENQLFNKIFDLNNQNEYFCYNYEKGENKTIFIVKNQKIDSLKILKKGQNFAVNQLFEMFINQAIDTLHNSKFQISNIQITVKSILNLLLFNIKIHEIETEQRLFLNLKQYLHIQNQSLFQIIRIFKSTNTDLATCIEDLYQNFINLIQKYQNRITHYKIEVSQADSIYLDFNKYGQLRFVSNKLPAIFFKRLKACNKSETDQITIFDLFKSNSEVVQFILNAVQGQTYEQPIDIYQDDFNEQLKLLYNQENQISRIQFKIFLKNSKKLKGSIEHFTSINTISSVESQKQQKHYILEKTGINTKAKKMLNQLEQQTPGVTKTGWIEAFMKNQVIDKYKVAQSKKIIQHSQKQISHHALSKKRLSIIQSMNIPILYQLSQNILQGIDIQSFGLNLLEIDQEKYFPLIQSVFNKLHFYEKSIISRPHFLNFLKELKTKYNKFNNQFHNFTHGINVMHFCYLISKFQQNKIYLNDINIFALVFSGLCHDVGHPGNTNVFQINSRSKKAIIYNDRSPLQNYHASKSYKILLKNQNNFLSHIKKQQFNQIRKQFIANILATDIKQHFPLVNNFQNKLKSPKGFQKTLADVELLTTFIIHTSDFAGASKTFDISRQWATRVNREFSRQYQKESQLLIPQTPHMKDLDKIDVMAKNEAGFMKVIVRPLYKSLTQFYTKEEITKKILQTIDQNVLIWEKIFNQNKNKNQQK